VTALQLTQDMPAMMALFEVFSALGTVGLSTGGTLLLDEIGKVIIMATMFAGRVGPLTLFLFLSDHSADSSWGYPEERVDVG
jgi:trk system potassium uptake protein TrkH